MDASVPTLGRIEPIERETIKRVSWRLLPLLMLGLFCSYLDRSNIGMAATTMNQQLGFSSTVFGFGAGVFFFGYFLAEVPSNLILNTMGARRWIARILFTWGVVSGLTAFVWNDWSFYGIRLLLGLAEAGFFPGVVLYMTWWFPSYYRARMIAIFFSASVISLFIGPPIGGLLMQMDGIMGLRGWQWLFIIEALPSVIMAWVTWTLLTDKPINADWLRPDQRVWLQQRLDSERAQREAVHKFSLAQAFYNPKVWLLTFAFVGNAMVGFGLIFFLPLIVKGLGVSTNWIGLVSAVPFMCAFVGLLYWGWHSDRTGERTWHVVGAWLLCAAGLAACGIIGSGHPILTMVAISLAAVGCQSVPAVFWSIPSALLSGTAAAGGIALINSIANLGGFLGPYAFGLVRDAGGSDNTALLLLAVVPVISSVLVIAAGHDRRMERIPPRS